MTDVIRELAALRQRVEELEREREESGPREDTAAPVSRRRLLGLTGATAAGVVGGAVLGASPAGAGAPVAVFLDETNMGTGTTRIDSTTTPGATFWGRNLTVGSNDAIGVAGQTASNLGIGVSGIADAGRAIRANVNSNNGVHLELLPTTQSGPPAAGTHTLGRFYMDQDGVLWQCVVAGTPGTWVRQAPLVPLAAPVRVYDSRAGQPNQAPNVQGSLMFTSAPPSATNRVIRCNKDASTGSTVAPANARSLLLNLAVVTLSGVGTLAVYADGAAQPAAASINWFAGGQVLSNAVTTACDTEQDVRVAIVSGAGASTNFILDVVGYYL